MTPTLPSVPVAVSIDDYINNTLNYQPVYRVAFVTVVPEGAIIPPSQSVRVSLCQTLKGANATYKKGAQNVAAFQGLNTVTDNAVLLQTFDGLLNRWLTLKETRRVGGVVTTFGH